MPGRECWTDIWEAIGPQIEQVMTTGEPTWHEDQYLPIERNGRLEDVWWTYSYSPVRDEEGRIAATLVVCQETTKRVVSQRERELLLEERRQAEESLRQSEARLRAIYDGTYEYIGLLAADGTVLSTNRASLEFANMRADDVMGRPFAETPWFVNTPGGNPASTVRSASSEQESGDHSAGFRITVHPAASAGAVFQVESMNGAFHGVITTAGPLGILTTRLCVPFESHTRSS